MDDMNATLSTITPAVAMNTTTVLGLPKHPNMFSIVIGVVYAIGIIGNAIAIVSLRTGERRVRNRKHLLLLTSLAANDLIALVGMMISMLVSVYYREVRFSQVYCATRVLLRVFGIGSVCIAVTMALERYLALTRPFLYQKRVTYFVIRTSLLLSWLCAMVLTCAPIFKLGAYYDEGDPLTGRKSSCIRYRNAVNSVQKGYAIVYITFGTFLCAILVYCNLAVIQALYAITAPRNGAQPVVRRVSKSSCRQRQRELNDGSGIIRNFHHNVATAEEVAFSRLMATLSVLFMICWLPQMVTSALFISLGPSSWNQPFLTTLAKVSDLLMLLNYVLDPFLYVLMRQRKRLSVTGLCHSIAHCFKRNHKTSTESMKTSCCPDTVVVSDSSGAEMRPLRVLPAPACGSLLRMDD